MTREYHELPSLRQKILRFLPLGILVFIWLIFVTPYVVKKSVPFPSQFLVTFFPPWSPYYGMPVKNNAMPDIITQIFPWRMQAITSWKRGVVPMWNPYSFSGTVHAANYQSDVFSPQNLLFLFLNPILAWSIIVLLQPLFAGIFMFICLKHHARSDTGSLLGSIAFMFSGFITVWMGYATLGYAVLVTPLLILGIKKYFENESWWYGILLSFVTLFSFVSGHFQMSVYVSLFAIGYAFYLSLFERKMKKLFHVLIFLFGGVLLALPQLVIAINAFFSSNRIDSYIESAGIPWRYLITILAPDFFGNPVTRNDWFGQYAEWSSFLGVIPFVFSIYGMLQSRNKWNYYFLFSLIVALFLATVSPLSWLFYHLHIPMLSTSVATRLIFFVSMILCIFSAYGIDAFKEDLKNNKISTMVRICVLSALVLVIGVVVMMILPGLPPGAKQTALRNSFFPLGILGITVVLSFMIRIKPRYQWLIISLFLVIATVDSLRFTTKWMPFDPPGYIYPNIPVIKYLNSLDGINRVFGNVGNELNTYYHIPSIEGYDAMYQARYGEFVTAAADGSIHPLERSVVKIDRQGKFTKRWFDLLGVRSILYRLSDGRNVWVFPHWLYPDIISQYKDDNYEVLTNQGALERAILASSFVVETDKNKILQHLTDENFNIHTSVVLEKNPPFSPQDGDGKLSFSLYSPERVVLRVDTSVPKLLFLSDTYEKGWKVLIDGEPSELLRADYAFRAVSVPKGLHTVEFYYAPDAMRRAVYLSLLAFILLLIGSVRQLRYERWNF